jgi:hypothetical protein
MSTIRSNAIFAVAAIFATSLLVANIGQNALAASGEIRLIANLNPPNGGIADGKAEFRDRGSEEKIKVQIEDVAKNARFTVKIDGVKLGTITTNSFGTGELERNTNDGQSVPNVQKGDLVQVFRGTTTTVVLSGRFQ